MRSGQEDRPSGSRRWPFERRPYLVAAAMLALLVTIAGLGVWGQTMSGPASSTAQSPSVVSSSPDWTATPESETLEPDSPAAFSPSLDTGSLPQVEVPAGSYRTVHVGFPTAWAQKRWFVSGMRVYSPALARFSPGRT